MNTEELVKEALGRVLQNITDHVFLEIQRDVNLFRDYVRLVANGNDESKYGVANSQIARSVKAALNDALKQDYAVKSGKESKTPMSALIQTFTTFYCTSAQ